MHKRIKRKIWRKYRYLVGVLIFAIIVFIFFHHSSHQFIKLNQPIDFTIIDDGQTIKLENIDVKTIDEAVKFYDSAITEKDRVFPSRENEIFNEDIIYINREKKVILTIDEDEQELMTYGEKLVDLFKRENIDLDDDDLTIPSKNTLIKRNMEAEIVKVDIKEEIETKKIPFQTIKKDDPKVSFLKKFTKVEGENGKKEIIYRIAYHNGKEMEREKVAENIIKEPVDEIIVQGTKVKLGKKHKGAASWYAHTGTMSAANRWLPKGSYVKVTNKANGKSVIVQINDRGPFVDGRIVDLDKVAFKKIASLGSGVIDVVMEEVVE
jgi:uncharacterized protein YabE (DUF348 family)